MAREVEAGSTETISYPAHCLVNGHIAERTGVDGKRYAIGFELRLPLGEGYAQRFFFQGGGGTDGVVNPAYGDLINYPESNALTRGYAVVSTDGGHDSGIMDVSFGLDPQARIDYGYGAVGRVTEVAKALVGSFYGSPPRSSYFVGCSNGGRQAIVAASRFGSQFDGVLAVDPGIHLPQAALAQAWDTQQFMAAAAPGQLPKDAFPPQALTTLASGILERCDELDGLRDGIVHDRAACQRAFALERDVATCGAGESVDCLSAAQKGALAGVFAGARDGSGASLYATWPWDPGVAGLGWRFWKLDAGFVPLPFNTIIGAGALGYIFTTPPDQPDLSDGGLGYQLTLDRERAATKLSATEGAFSSSAVELMTAPDPTLGALLDGGGKLIVVQGTADPVFSADDAVRWYDRLLAAAPEAAAQTRLYLVPGMNHCSGGPATDRFDLLAALEAWVEHGTAPAAVVASVSPGNPDVAALGWPSTRARPLCPYPQHAALLPGAADSELASSFSCQ